MTIRLAILITIIIGVPLRRVFSATLEPIKFYPSRHLSALEFEIMWLTLAIVASVMLWAVWPFVREWYDRELKDLEIEE